MITNGWQHAKVKSTKRDPPWATLEFLKKSLPDQRSGPLKMDSHLHWAPTLNSHCCWPELKQTKLLSQEFKVWKISLLAWVTNDTVWWQIVVLFYGFWFFTTNVTFSGFHCFHCHCVTFFGHFLPNTCITSKNPLDILLLEWLKYIFSKGSYILFGYIFGGEGGINESFNETDWRDHDHLC